MLLLERDLTKTIVDSAIEVHRALGPGLLETAYRACLVHQLQLSTLQVETEVPVPVTFKGVAIPTAFRADLIVERKVLIELKARDGLLPIHEAQLLTYLKLTGLKIGFLINFNVPRLHLGLRRYAR
jgi:GxxExxY protein